MTKAKTEVETKAEAENKNVKWVLVVNSKRFAGGNLITSLKNNPQEL